MRYAITVFCAGLQGPGSPRVLIQRALIKVGLPMSSWSMAISAGERCAACWKIQSAPFAGAGAKTKHQG